MDEKQACYILSSTDGIGSRALKRMLEYAGSYKECLIVDVKEFKAAGILSKKQCENLLRSKAMKEMLLKELDGFVKKGIRIYFEQDADYPERLKLIDDAPKILYVRGELPRDDTASAAIIGARQCSGYGISAAEFFAGELAANGVQIISGLAYGIDAAASAGAIKAGGVSFAVLGSGVNVCYPRENYGLYRKLSETDEDGKGRGGVISEFHPHAGALPAHFVMRNRIIAGLCDVLIVIEAREKSGTFVTVGYALDQGKDVFALPGRITDPLGRGCNRLLKDGAIPLTEPMDVLEHLGVSGKAEKTIRNRSLTGLSQTEKAIYRQLSENPLHIEEIAAKSGIDIGHALSAAYSLEQKGYALNTMSAYYKKV